jgi:hypothetical protein
MSSAVPRTSGGSSTTVSAKLVSPTLPRACPAFHTTASPGADRTVTTSLRVLGAAGSSHAFIWRSKASGLGGSAAPALALSADSRARSRTSMGMPSINTSDAVEVNVARVLVSWRPIL